MSSNPPYASFSPSSTSTTAAAAAAEFAQTTTQIHHTVLSKLRPWRTLLDPHAISLPISFSEFTYRLRLNLHYFRMNYALITLVILFVSLIFHPISLIVFLIVFVAWLYLYFFRDDPIEVFNRTFDDRVVLIFLTLVTIVALILTRVWKNVVVSIAIGVFLVCLHAAFRAPEELDDRESPYGSLLSVVDSPRGPYNPV